MSTVYLLDTCCNTASGTASPASCLSVGFRAPPAPAPPLYDGSTAFQQLAGCGVPRLSGPSDVVASATGKPTHQFAHDLLTLHRLYTPPQTAADHFKPPFFPGMSIDFTRTTRDIALAIEKPPLR